jgi:peptidoglycan LD-endopeptidase CwlK
VHPDLVRVVEHAIQITTQDFRVQEGVRTLERRAALVRAAPAGP